MNSPNDLAEALDRREALLTVTTNMTVAHELVLAAILKRQDGDTLRAAAADLKEFLQTSSISGRKDIEDIKNATSGVWRTAGLDWPSDE